MSQLITGPGVGLPIPQNLYPSELNNAPYDYGSNIQTLAPGQEVPIPNGRWLFNTGKFSVMEFQDPLNNIWRASPDFMSARGGLTYFEGDGFTRRIANRLGCPIGAVVVGGGSAWVQATAAITANTGGSTWQALVGGSVSVTAINNAGGLYTVPPLVLIPSPAGPATNSNGIGGVPASGYATIAASAGVLGNTVSGVTLQNVGAGYANVNWPLFPPTLATGQLVLLPNPTDPNIGTIVNATVTFALTNAGKITAALCTNPGGVLSSMTALTLTAAGGAGTGATIVPLVLQTATSIAVIAGGNNLTGTNIPALVTSVGGIANTISAITNPAIEFTGFVPRPFQGVGVNGGLSIASVTTYDSGLFLGGLAPTPVVAPGAFSLTAMTMASLTFTMGTTIDAIMLQPL